jgi:hypothetical protein
MSVSKCGTVLYLRLTELIVVKTHFAVFGSELDILPVNARRRALAP